MTPDQNERETFVYRCYGRDDVLLYIGCSFNVRMRLSQHVTERSGWVSACFVITTESFPTRTAALAAEREAIRAERPVFNTQGSGAWSPMQEKRPIIRDHQPAVSA